ncbi:MAG: gephyrin-like molybdotransferase Glp [Ferruginibacter sp.]
MIAVATAKKIIQENISPLGSINLPLLQALGMVLSRDIFADLDIPAYPQSSMDGYAFSYNSWQPENTLNINGEMQAGADAMISCLSGQAIRIFTGAAVPEGADTVVMQEKVTIENGELKIADEKIICGSNVRPKGSEIKTGELALAKGTVLTPAALGFLAGIGITHADVFKKPVLSIIVTGKELQQPGQPLNYGQVYESNSYTLIASLQQLNITDVQLFWADDEPGILTGILSTALQQSDVVLLTGGVSVGDYDFVLQAAVNCNVKQQFHKIKQRPGKPIYFGTLENKLVFGLPGNPSSVLTCFYEYVTPALQELSSNPATIKMLKVPLGKAIKKAAGLTHFLKGWFDGEKATPLDAQESYRLSSFARANCLIMIDENLSDCQAGEMVEIHLLT